MRILALESSAKQSSVAFVEDGKLIAQNIQNAGQTHSKTLLPMTHSLLRDLGLTIQDADQIAVAHGPGSFTGIRIGVATAKGLAMGADKPLIGVSTLEAMAHQAKHLGDGILCPVMDARREQVYNALFEVQKGTLKRLIADRTVPISTLFDPMYDEKYILVGDGANLCFDWLNNKSRTVKILPPHLVLQTAWGVAMAAQNQEGVHVHAVNPHYIRPSQAERERLEKEGE